MISTSDYALATGQTLELAENLEAIRVALTAGYNAVLSVAEGSAFTWQGFHDASGADPTPVDGGFWAVTVTGTVDGQVANAGDVFISDGTNFQVINQAVIEGGLLAANNLSDVGSVATSQSNLQLGTNDSPTFAGLTINSAAPNLDFYESDGASDEKRWGFSISNGNLTLRSLDDAYTAERALLTGIRGTGNAIDEVQYGNSTDNPDHTHYGNGTYTGNILTVGDAHHGTPLATTDNLFLNSTGGIMRGAMATGMHFNHGALYNAGSLWEYAETGSAVSNMYLGQGEIGLRRAASGTAGNSVTWETMGIFNSAGLGIGGNTDPGAMHGSHDDLVIGDGVGDRGLTIYSGASDYGGIAFADAASGTARYEGVIYYEHPNNKMEFWTATTETASIGANNFSLVDGGLYAKRTGIGVVTGVSHNARTALFESTTTNGTADVVIADADNDASRYSFAVYGAGGATELFSVASNGQHQITNPSTGSGLNLRQTGNGVGFRLDSSATTEICMNVSSPTSGYMAYINSEHASNPYGVQVDFSAASPNGTANHFFYGQDSTTVRHQMRSNGGYANYQANDVNLSDERTKDIIGRAPLMWDEIQALHVDAFRYKDQNGQGKIHFSPTAQTAMAANPEWVDAGGWGENESYWSIYEHEVKYAMLGVIQELQRKVTHLEHMTGFHTGVLH